jgi:hypothetical protein
MNDTTTVLSFTPAVECWHCGQPATYGVYDVPEQLLRVGCSTHGYAWDVDDLGAEMASIERFVVAQHGGLGRARVLARLADVLYHDGSSDYVWQVEYRCDGQPEQGRVTWDNSDLCFEYYAV